MERPEQIAQATKAPARGLAFPQSCSLKEGAACCAAICIRRICCRHLPPERHGYRPRRCSTGMQGLPRSTRLRQRRCEWHWSDITADRSPSLGHRPRRARLPGHIRHGPGPGCVHWRRGRLQSPERLFGDASRNDIGGEAAPQTASDYLGLDWHELGIQGTSLRMSATAGASPAPDGSAAVRMLSPP